MPMADHYEAIMRSNLVVIAQAYADGMGWSLATVSKQVHGNQAFFANFAAGKVSTSLKTYFAMVDKFIDNWPAGTPWPKTIPIPELGKNIAK